jgi:hypothetical protein
LSYHAKIEFPVKTDQVHHFLVKILDMLGQNCSKSNLPGSKSDFLKISQNHHFWVKIRFIGLKLFKISLPRSKPLKLGSPGQNLSKKIFRGQNHHFVALSIFFLSRNFLVKFGSLELLYI